jgi:hypothetical protein
MECLRQFSDEFFSSFLAEDRIAWTSGVPCASNDSGQVNGTCKSLTWCSSKKTMHFNYTIASKLKAPCVAYDRSSKQFFVNDCRKKALVICEVSWEFLGFFISSMTFIVFQTKCYQNKCPDEKLCRKNVAK